MAADPAGLELLEPLLLPSEFAVLKGAEPTLGLQKVGAEGLESLRKQATCTVESVKDDGAERWKVQLTRVLPLVKTDGTFGDWHEQELYWSAVETDQGVRMDIGLEKAAEIRASLKEAAEQDDPKRIAGLWHALANAYPDPLLVYDVEAADMASAERYVLGRLRVGFDRIEDPPEDAAPETKSMVVARVTNPSKWTIETARFAFTFEIANGQRVIEGPSGAIAPQETIEVKVELPEDAIGKVSVEARSVTLKPGAS